MLGKCLSNCLDNECVRSVLQMQELALRVYCEQPNVRKLWHSARRFCVDAPICEPFSCSSVTCSVRPATRRPRWLLAQRTYHISSGSQLRSRLNLTLSCRGRINGNTANLAADLVQLNPPSGDYIWCDVRAMSHSSLRGVGWLGATLPVRTASGQLSVRWDWSLKLIPCVRQAFRAQLLIPRRAISTPSLPVQMGASGSWEEM